MRALGFVLVRRASKDGYYKYVCDGKTFYCRAYNKECPLPRGKRVVYINTTYNPDANEVFVNVREDGDSRNCYYGVVKDAAFLEQVILNAR